MKIGKRQFDMKNHGYIMGILNVTPDSFSDGGRYTRLDAALKHAEQMLGEGADIIDVGGESTRPGHEKALKREFDPVISLDTYKWQVAEEGIRAGADMINDIWGLKWDGKMAPLLAREGLPACLMHNRKNTDYKNFLSDVIKDLRETMQTAGEAGMRKEQILLDPGIGFAKTLEQNLMLMNHLELLLEFQVPVLLGTSRKSMIGFTLDLPADERTEGTVATTVSGYMKGCRMFRVHDVKENRRALTMIEAICRY